MREPFSAREESLHLDTLDTAKSLARFLGCSESKIRKATNHDGMPCVRLGRVVRYSRSTVLTWLQAQQHGKTNGNGKAAKAAEAVARD